MKKDLEALRNGDELVRYAIQHGAKARNGKGSHVIVSTDRGACVVPVHAGDLGKGLRLKIVKVFLAIGLAALPLICLAVALASQ